VARHAQRLVDQLRVLARLDAPLVLLLLLRDEVGLERRVELGRLFEVLFGVRSEL